VPTIEESLKQIDETLEALLMRFDELDHDGFDVDSGDGKLTVEMEADGKQFILSRQRATGELWLAEPRGGWHFAWNGEQWICDKRGVELVATLQGHISEALGETIEL